MFETGRRRRHVDDAAFEQAEAGLRTALLQTQYAVLEQARFPVIVVTGGVEGAGRGETANLLTAWMDPRHIHAHAFGDLTPEEREHPPMWRYWRTLPPNGRVGLYFSSWYTQPVVEHAFAQPGQKQLRRTVEKIFRFEQLLADEGALIIKFWFHISKKVQRERFEALERNPLTRWRVTATDWKHHRQYAALRDTAAHVLQATSTPYAPWFVIDGEDANYRSLVTLKLLLDAMQRRLAENPRASRGAAAPTAGRPGAHKYPASLDLTRSLPRDRYRTELEKQQGALNRLSRHPRFRRRGAVVVFEGMDAAGKGGAIRRVTGALDARFYQVVPVAAPSTEEQAHPYLWRFWRHIPRRGRFTLFDRSWYGRVLVERVDGHASTPEWRRAYGEINDFERELSDGGLIVVKFWLAIDRREQLARFRAREKTPFKQYKITADDWRNRARWDAYQTAAADMFQQTSTGTAPWTAVEANDKYFARIKVLRTLCERLEAEL
jgi:polyphosphate:AMP phosphotransferase